MTVKEIAPSNPEPKADVVERLEELLFRAKSGEIQGIAYAVDKPRTTANGWVGMTENSAAMIGEVSILHRDMMDLLIKLRIDPQTGEETHP